MGTATGSAAGLDEASQRAVPAARVGANPMARNDAARSLRLWRSWSPEGFHSSNRCFVNSRRPRVRMIASRL